MKVHVAVVMLACSASLWAQGTFVQTIEVFREARSADLPITPPPFPGDYGLIDTPIQSLLQPAQFSWLAPTPVPEPSPVALTGLAVSVFVLFGCARKKQRPLGGDVPN